MRDFWIWRMAEEPGVWTLSRLEDAEHKQLAVIAERGWVDKDGNGIGDRNESRIPSGVYECTRDMHNKTSPDAYEVWEINGVPGRSEIHIHVGNDPRRDSKGCPLIGTAWGPGGTVTQSKAAFQKWMKLTAKDERIRLTVVDIPK